MGGCRTESVRRILTDMVFTNDCPKFGSMPMDKDRASYYLLLSESLPDDRNVLGYALFGRSPLAKRSLEFHQLFEVPLVDLPELMDTKKYFECVPTPWNTSGTALGDLLCDQAEQDCALVSGAGELLHKITRGNYGEASAGKLRANRHPSVFLWPP